MQVSIPMGGEEEYMSWSKRINRLKCSREGRQLLFLPLRETYSDSGDLFCDSTHQATLAFPPYAHTLYDNLAANVHAQQRYTEAEAWYLIYTLAAYALRFEKAEEASRLTFHSVLIAHDGGLRVIPEIVTPSMEVQARLFLASKLRVTQVNR